MIGEHLPDMHTGKVAYAVRKNGIHTYFGTTPSAN